MKNRFILELPTDIPKLVSEKLLNYLYPYTYRPNNILQIQISFEVILLFLLNYQEILIFSLI